MGIVSINGAFENEDFPPREAGLHYHFSVGVYETLRTVRGRLFNWAAHAERLQHSAQGMGFTILPEQLEMFRKFVVLESVVLCLLFILSGTSYAMRLLTQEEALKKVFGPEVKIISETKELTEPALSKATELYHPAVAVRLFSAALSKKTPTVEA